MLRTRQMSRLQQALREGRLTGAAGSVMLTVDIDPVSLS